jgi:hypothetical protein
MKKYHVLFLALCLISVGMFSCHSFSYEKKIADGYYLIGVDAEDYLTISRKLNNGDYIGRIPAKVLKYGVVDSFIIARSEQKGVINYYIVNMNKDHEYAHEEEFLIGPLSENEFNEQWQSELKVNLKQPE